MRQTNCFFSASFSFKTVRQSIHKVALRLLREPHFNYLSCELTDKTNGTYNIDVSGLDYSTTYNWSVNVTDGVHFTNVSYYFTTRSNAPVLSNPNPGDGASGMPFNPLLSIYAYDFDGDLMNIVFS